MLLVHGAPIRGGLPNNTCNFAGRAPLRCEFPHIAAMGVRSPVRPQEPAPAIIEYTMKSWNRLSWKSGGREL